MPSRRRRKSRTSRTTGSPASAPTGTRASGRQTYPLDFAHPILRLYAFSVDLSIVFMLFIILNLLTRGNFASADAAPQDIFVFFGYFILEGSRIVRHATMNTPRPM